VYYLGTASGRGAGAAEEVDTMISGLSPAAVIGDMDGDGTSELIVGQATDDRVEVYRIDPGSSPQYVAQLAAFDNSGVSGSSNIAVGDVDPSEPGNELVVGEDGSRRRAAQLRIFGGFSTGNPRLLLRFQALRPWAASRSPLVFALGDVLGNADSFGQQIVVGDSKGRIYVYGVRQAAAVPLRRFLAFPDPPRCSAHRLAVGDLIPGNTGDEIAVGDDGTRQDGLVRVLDGRSGIPLLEFEAFSPGQAPAGVELWVGDVISSLPGAELIVGQGEAGGILRVFSVAQGVPVHVLDVPDPLHRTTSLHQHLAIGELIPELPGNEIAVAQIDPHVPVQVFHLDENGAGLIDELAANAAAAATTETVAIGP
jgi:hypothetical protein